MAKFRVFPLEQARKREKGEKGEKGKRGKEGHTKKLVWFAPHRVTAFPTRADLIRDSSGVEATASGGRHTHPSSSVSRSATKERAP